MGHVILNVGIVLVLILIEGVFVAAEIALVSLREGQVRQLAGEGRRGAIVARLTSDPNRFLASVQIGVTSTALLSSAFGAVTLSDEVTNWLTDSGWSHGLAHTVGLVGVTLLISFVTLVLGELAPKRLALQRTESAALFFAGPLNRIAGIFRPVIWLLSLSTNGVVRILGGDPEARREPITEEELRGLVAAHETLTSDERRLIDDVFDAGGRSIGEVMVPRTEVHFLDASLTVSRAARVAAETPHQRYPVVGENQDDVIGYVALLDLLLTDTPGNVSSRDRTVRQAAHEIKAMPATKPVLAALSEMRREGQRIALVVDEYGGTDGIVTLEDLVEEIVGDIRAEGGATDSLAERAADGAVEVDGKANLDEVAEMSGLELPEGPYATLAGFVMAELGRIPTLGDEVHYDGYVLTVSSIDGRRAARITVSRRAPGEIAEPADESMGNHG